MINSCGAYKHLLGLKLTHLQDCLSYKNVFYFRKCRQQLILPHLNVINGILMCIFINCLFCVCLGCFKLLSLDQWTWSLCQTKGINHDGSVRLCINKMDSRFTQRSQYWKWKASVFSSCETVLTILSNHFFQTPFYLKFKHHTRIWQSNECNTWLQS